MDRLHFLTLQSHSGTLLSATGFQPAAPPAAPMEGLPPPSPRWNAEGEALLLRSPLAPSRLPPCLPRLRHVDLRGSRLHPARRNRPLVWDHPWSVWALLDTGGLPCRPPQRRPPHGGRAARCCGEPPALCVRRGRPSRHPGREGQPCLVSCSPRGTARALRSTCPVGQPSRPHLHGAVW